MSAEIGVTALVLKYVWLPVIGMLSWFIKGYLNKLDTRLTLSEQKVGVLELELTKNYYDKVEIQQHIVEPLQRSMEETKAELKTSSRMLTEIHQTMAILKFKILGEDTTK